MSVESLNDTHEFGDLPPGEFRAAAHRVADMLADYLEGVGRYPVVPPISPGAVRRSLPSEPPQQAETLDRILDDYQEKIEPNVTHWNHPGFLAYFAITGSGPGILGEALAAGLNVNAMLWKTGPSPTELEELVCDWLRQMIGLPQGFVGHINDTASMSTLVSLAAARHRLGAFRIRERGMSGRPDLPTLRIYCSDQAHSSVDKAALTLGLGTDNVIRVASDCNFRMKVDELEARIAADRGKGFIPLAVVATAGTTSTTSVDPLDDIGQLCTRQKLWLHVDAAYAGSAAICPEFRALMVGMERADSIVLNPHKWLFTPVDCSVLLVRDPALLKEAFSLVPDYLRTHERDVTNLMDYGVQLGRRFRSLKLWMVIRSFGVEGLQKRIRRHCELARYFASWVEGDPDFELCAPVPFSTICFRFVGDEPGKLDARNEGLLEQVNRDGQVFLSSTRIQNKLVLRLAVGNLRTQERHVRLAWELVKSATGAKV